MARLVLFAAAREFAGGVSHAEVPASTLGEVLEWAADAYGTRFAALLARSSILVDEEQVDPTGRDLAVTDRTEVCVLPPVSGGAPGIDDDRGGRGHHDHAHDGHHGQHDHGDRDGHHGQQGAPGSGDGSGDHTAVTVAVLTSSTRAAAGDWDDKGGDAVVEAVTRLLPGARVVARTVIPDDRGQLEATMKGWADEHRVQLVLTTGGTGLTPTDVVPEATLDVIDRQVPGLAEVMRTEGRKATPMAALSRQVAGARGHTLIVNLPGNPQGAVESLESVAELLPHAIRLLAGDGRH